MILRLLVRAAFFFGEYMFIYNSVSDFNILFKSLEFNKINFSKDNLLAQHHSEAGLRLKNFIEKDECIDVDLCLALKTLPAYNFQRLVESPYLAELIIICAKATKENQLQIKKQIKLALVAEVQFANPIFQHSLNPKWTVNGDIVLDSKIAQIVPALKTRCGIALNYQSYIHNTGKNGIGGYDYSTALKHKERIETAKSLVVLASSSATSLIDSYTTNIQFRQNTERTNVVNSSTETSIGLIRSDNFHKIHNDLPEIVDMLVHESIHQYLHLFEEQIFDFVHIEALPKSWVEEREFPSPWSGNLLDLRSYTHAVLVWYGLIHFWSQYIDKNISHDELTIELAVKKLNEAKYGFIKTDDVLENLGYAKKYLNQDYILNVKTIQKRIKAMKL